MSLSQLTLFFHRQRSDQHSRVTMAATKPIKSPSHLPFSPSPYNSLATTPLRFTSVTTTPLCRNSTSILESPLSSNSPYHPVCTTAGAATCAANAILMFRGGGVWIVGILYARVTGGGGFMIERGEGWVGRRGGGRVDRGGE